MQNTRLQGRTVASAVSQLSVVRDAALHVSGSVNAGGMLTPNAANHNSGARPRTDSSTDGLNLSSYGDYIAKANNACQSQHFNYVAQCRPAEPLP